MVASASAIQSDLNILKFGADLRQQESVTRAVDVALLPKAIGGNAVTVGEDRKEDERCSRGQGQPRLSAFLSGLALEAAE